MGRWGDGEMWRYRGMEVRVGVEVRMFQGDQCSVSCEETGDR